jgi:hypothetical protein
MLGLSNVTDSHQIGDIFVPDDMVMPHGPPPRHSSLDMGVRLDTHPKYIEPEPLLGSTDMRSVVSGSITGTDTSASAEFLSTSPSSKEHPLSSATTSLSRSAKSSKEGALSDEKDAALSAIRLQRSLEWEARQGRHRRRMEKRRMILLELVETEVAYTEDLKTLVQVYLPQLYALPSVSERTADLVARNAKELLDIHLKMAGRMVEVMKEESLGYEPEHPEPIVCKQLERVSRRLAAIFVEEVGEISLNDTDHRHRHSQPTTNIAQDPSLPLRSSGSFRKSPNTCHTSADVRLSLLRSPTPICAVSLPSRPTSTITPPRHLPRQLRRVGIARDCISETF